MTQNPTLYWDLQSAPCRAVKALLEIGKVNCQYVKIDLNTGQTFSPKFRSINPIGRIPFLKHGDFQVSESDAILIYIYEAFKQIPRSYYGQTPEERAMVNQYIAWYQWRFRPKMFRLVVLIKGHFFKQQTIYQSQVDEFYKEMDEVVLEFNKILVGKNYMANNTPTIADLLFYFEMTSLPFYGREISNYKEIDRWFKNIYAISEVKALTHEWFPLGKQLNEAFKQIDIKKSKL